MAQINPINRIYLFRVVDDGLSVTMTIIDPRQQNNIMSITSLTTTALKQGFVGFESCWGSPIKLDDVRIDQGSTAVKNIQENRSE